MLARHPHRLWIALFFFALTALLVGPLWQRSGLPNSADGLLHLHRAAAVERAFAQGVFWPRWFPDIYDGLGAPTFHHYSPGLYWLVAGLHWGGIGLDLALKSVLTVGFVLAGLATYAWLRHLFSPAAALAGAAVFLAQPHFFREFYFQGDYPQLLALLLLPVCLWAYTALHRRAHPLHWLAAVAGLAGLVLSHNLTAMLGAGLLGVYWLGLAALYRNPSGLLRCAGAAVVAALLSAGFWLPALADTPLVQVDNLQREFFYYAQYFLDWQELFALQMPLDSRAANPPVPHSFGPAVWLALISGAVAAGFARGARRFWGWAGGLWALALLGLTLPISEPLWEALPGLNLLQFPARLLPVATLGALLAGGAAVDVWPAARRWLAAALLLTLALLAAFPFLFPGQPFLQIPALTGADTRAYERASGVWGMTSGNEFLPRGADPAIATGQAPHPNALELAWRSPHTAAVEIPAGQPQDGQLLRLHFHPGWQTDGAARLVAGEAGWAQAQLSGGGVGEGVGEGAGDRTVVLRWRGTGWQAWGEGLSLLGLLLAGLGLAVFALRRGRQRGGQARRKNLEPARQAARLTAVVLLLLGLRLAIDRSGSGLFQRQSPPGALAQPVGGEPTAGGTAVLGTAELGTAETGQVALLGWELLTGKNPRPGQAVRLRLYWQPVRPLAENFHSFVHLYTPGLKQSWAISQNQNPGRIPTSSWLPALYYVDELRLAIPPDVPPVAYSLAVGLARPGTGERLSVPGSEDGLLLLGPVEVVPLRAGRGQAQRADFLARARTDAGLGLQGYDLLPAPGGPILRLFWEGRGEIAQDWQVFIHLYGPDGARVAQFDGPPLAGLLPTSQWQPGRLYIDRRPLPLPGDLPPGDYLFRVGLFRPDSGERLPLRPDGPGADRLRDGQLLIPLTVPEN